MSANLILLGHITGAHGIRGAVKIKSFTSDPKDIASYGPLQASGGRAIEILRLKPAKDEFIADLKDVKDRNAAEALSGTDLFIAREKLPPLKPGEFYLNDLIGKDVVGDGTRLGKVASIENYGAGDLMELDNGELIPVAFISAAGDNIAVTLPPSYLEPATREDQHH